MIFTDKSDIGFAMCGSFCTFKKVIPQIEKLVNDGFNVLPIMSYNAYSTDTRFGNADDFIGKIENICSNKIVHTLNDAEPIGPKKLIDALIVEPCTGNTAAKIALGIADTPVTLAVKSTLRNARPIIIAISTNDGLGNASKNIGLLQNSKNIFFVPYCQDDSEGKPNSLVADFDKTEDTLINALENRQIQPVLI